MRKLACLALFAFCLAPPARAQTFRADRLERLAVHLETNVPPRNFTMSIWSSGPDASAADYRGCVGGHATYLFADEGLEIRFMPGFHPSNSYYAVAFGKRCNFAALESFFGLTQDESQALFTGRDCTMAEMADPKAAARRIRAVIKARAKPPEAVASK